MRRSIVPSLIAFLALLLVAVLPIGPALPPWAMRMVMFLCGCLYGHSLAYSYGRTAAN